MRTKQAENSTGTLTSYPSDNVFAGAVRRLPDDANAEARILNLASCSSTNENAKYNRLKELDTYLRDGGNPNCRMAGTQTTLMMLFAHDGDTRAIRLLASASKADIDAVDREGSTALMYAVLGECPDTVEGLLSLGASCSIRNRYGRSAMDLVPDENMVKQMMSHIIKERIGKTHITALMEMDDESIEKALEGYRSKDGKIHTIKKMITSSRDMKRIFRAHMA